MLIIAQQYASANIVDTTATPPLAERVPYAQKKNQPSEKLG